MAIKSPFGEVNLDVNAGLTPSADPSTAVLEPETPLRILVIGDFSGHAAAAKPAKAWRPLEIDRDIFEEVLARLAPECDGLRFTELDDFHPDRLYQTKPCHALRELRRRLEDSSTFAQAAAEIRTWAGDEAPPSTPAKTPPPQRAPLPDFASGRSLLDSMLEASEPSPPPTLSRRGDLQSFVERVVAPHTVPAEPKDLPRLRGLLDAETGARLRAILHHPPFQSLEAAWRAMFRLVRAVETGSQLKLYLLDVSKAELAADLNTSDDLRQSRLWRLLVDETVGSGADPWGAVAGNFVFAQKADDARLLGRIAKIMSFAGSPFLAEADPGASTEAPADDAQPWERLRQTPEACWIGLAMPRFLVRLPYGKETDRVETFDFEEMPTPRHQQYLWGNPAFACLQLMAESFSSDGWDMRPGTHSEIDRLPLHVYEADGEKQIKPCAEVLLTDHDIEWILEQGYMPLATKKNSDIARLIRFQSIAKPLARLSGRWG